MKSSIPDDDFEAAVAGHLSVLRGVALREVGSADSEDVVQEALIRAWRRWATFDPTKGTVRAWLVAILVDRCRRHRSLRRRISSLVPWRQEAYYDTTTRLDPILESAISHLPARQRQVIVLHYLADLSVADTAVALGISDGAVKAHLHGARGALRSRLEGFNE